MPLIPQGTTVDRRPQNTTAAIGLCLGLSLILSSAARLASAGPAEEYVERQLRVVQALEGHLDGVINAADESATRLIAGGKIYLAGQRGMVAELLGRAGGLCAARALDLSRPLPPLSPNDVVLLSDYGLSGPKDTELWRKLLDSPALVIAFASHENPLLQQPLRANVRAIPVEIPRESRLVQLASGERLIPLAPPALATAEWTYTAELIGACRRQNKQLAVYLSLFLDEGHKRYLRTKDLTFEPDLRVEPVARGEYARQFLASARKGLEAVRQGEMGNIRKAAAWIKEAKAARRSIVRNLMGHLPPAEVGLPGNPPFFTGLTRGMADDGVKWIRENLHEGDLYLFLGYQQNEDGMSAAANALGARTIFLTFRAPGAAQAANPRHLYVNPHWPLTDGCLELPGYDVKACPLSCILGLTCYYAIAAEVLSPSSVEVSLGPVESRNLGQNPNHRNHTYQSRDAAIVLDHAGYKIRYGACVDKEHGGKVAPLEGYLGMPEPTSCNWYHSGFLWITVNGKDIGSTPLSSMTAAERGPRGILDLVWHDEQATVRTRFLGLPQHDNLYLEVAIDPKQEIKSLGLRLTCYPSYFTHYNRREGARRIQTPKTLVLQGQQLTLPARDNWWGLYCDEIFDVANGEGEGPCGLLLMPEEAGEITLQPAGYAVGTQITYPPQTRRIHLALWDFKGQTNAQALARLRQGAEEVRSELAALDFTPTAVKGFDMAGLRAEVDRALKSAEVRSTLGSRIKELETWLAQYSTVLQSTGGQGSIEAEERLLQAIQKYESFCWEVKLAELLSNL
jgi:hypothetical protein